MTMPLELSRGQQRRLGGIRKRKLVVVVRRSGRGRKPVSYEVEEEDLYGGGRIKDTPREWEKDQKA